MSLVLHFQFKLTSNQPCCWLSSLHSHAERHWETSEWLSQLVSGGSQRCYWVSGELTLGFDSPPRPALCFGERLEIDPSSWAAHSPTLSPPAPPPRSDYACGRKCLKKTLSEDTGGKYSSWAEKGKKRKIKSQWLLHLEGCEICPPHFNLARGSIAQQQSCTKDLVDLTFQVQLQILSAKQSVFGMTGLQIALTTFH